MSGTTIASLIVIGIILLLAFLLTRKRSDDGQDEHIEQSNEQSVDKPAYVTPVEDGTVRRSNEQVFEQSDNIDRQDERVIKVVFDQPLNTLIKLLIIVTSISLVLLIISIVASLVMWPKLIHYIRELENLRR